MVKGRRLKTTVANSTDVTCYSPKGRTDQLKKYKRKLISRNDHCITDYFKLESQDEELQLPLPLDCSDVINSNYSIGLKLEDVSPIKNQKNVLVSSPHRIELHPPVVKQETNASDLKLNKIIKKPTKTATVDHKLTEYFPIRRSVRKTKKTVLEEKQKTLEMLLRKGIEDGMTVHHFDDKGRGIIATKPFYRGDFVVEYSGELLDMAQAKVRETKYAQDLNTGCYMYYFKYQNQQYCVDATAETGRLGRLVNHSRNGNLMTRTVAVDGLPRLVLIAKDDVKVGEELTYDYGDRSKESLKNHPWLAF